MQALNTTPTWQYTFFAPSNKAFNNTGQYYETNSNTPKGKWWLGNLIQHHYVPNSKLNTSAFSRESTRIQTGSYLYISTQVVDNNLILNGVARVTTSDIEVTNVCIRGLIGGLSLIERRASSISSITFSTQQPKSFSPTYPKPHKPSLREAVQTLRCHIVERREKMLRRKRSTQLALGSFQEWTQISSYRTLISFALTQLHLLLHQSPE